jgi:hypothetical protein
MIFNFLFLYSNPFFVCAFLSWKLNQFQDGRMDIYSENSYVTNLTSYAPTFSPVQKPSAVSPLSSPSFSPVASPSTVLPPAPIPTAIVPTLSVGNNGTFTGRFRIVRANLKRSAPLKVFGTYATGAIINVTKFGNVPLSLDVEVTCCFHVVRFSFNGVTTNDRTSPYTLRGNDQNKYKDVPALRSRGSKRIVVQGISTARKVFRRMNLNFTVVR